jgi:LuxR family maltose regulon positive regulatory protein
VIIAKATDFLNQMMGLNLSPEDITALETRTEGWIAGLQLAALSMQGHQDTAGFIKSFTSSAPPGCAPLSSACAASPIVSSV